MVYLNDESLTWRQVFSSWLRGLKQSKQVALSEEAYSIVEQNFATVFPQVLLYAQSLPSPIRAAAPQLTLNACQLFETLLLQRAPQTETPEQAFSYLNLLFIHALAWSFAATLQDKEAEKVDAFIKKKFNNVEFPPESIVNCGINFEGLYLESLSPRIPHFQFDPAQPFWEILVPTIDTLKLETILALHLERQRNVYLTGNSGTGKSTLALKVLQRLQQSALDSFKIHFSTRTSSSTVQETLLGSLFFLSQRS